VIASTASSGEESTALDYILLGALACSSNGNYYLPADRDSSAQQANHQELAGLGPKEYPLSAGQEGPPGLASRRQGGWLLPNSIAHEERFIHRGTSGVDRVTEEARAAGLMAVRTWGKSCSHRAGGFADRGRLEVGKHLASVRE
jgi:hypothetical protein